MRMKYKQESASRSEPRERKSRAEDVENKPRGRVKKRNYRRRTNKIKTSSQRKPRRTLSKGSQELGSMAKTS